jgi:hypothetical protein
MHPTGGPDVCRMKLLPRRTPELTGVKSERGGVPKKNRGPTKPGAYQKVVRVARGDDSFRL